MPTMAGILVPPHRHRQDEMGRWRGETPQFAAESVRIAKMLDHVESDDEVEAYIAQRQAFRGACDQGGEGPGLAGHFLDAQIHPYGTPGSSLIDQLSAEPAVLAADLQATAVIPFQQNHPMHDRLAIESLILLGPGLAAEELREVLLLPAMQIDKSPLRKRAGARKGVMVPAKPKALEPTQSIGYRRMDSQPGLPGGNIVEADQRETPYRAEYFSRK